MIDPTPPALNSPWRMRNPGQPRLTGIYFLMKIVQGHRFALTLPPCVYITCI